MKKKGELSDSERALFENVQNGNTLVVKELLSKDDVDVNCLDDYGMTPLQNTAFKANVEMCQILLSHGADVNKNEHENGYTTLMFAALSGNTEVTKMMLDAGAKTSPVNSVGRNACQMAAFVGQHECVTVIKNFFPSDELNYYTVPHGFEKEPKLRTDLAPTLHKFILCNNVSPVKLALFLKENMELVNETPKITKVLEHICEKQMKASETNDVLALKMHYLVQVLEACRKWDVEKTDVGIDGFIKVLLKERESDGVPIGMEKFIRDAIREFPYHDSELFVQVVRNLADTQPGREPSALVMLTQSINGTRSIEIEDLCSACNEPKAEKKCSACKYVRYCNQSCQKLHWFTHKKRCKELGEKLKKAEAEKIRREEEERKRKQKEAEEAARQKEEESKGEDSKEKEGEGAITSESQETDKTTPPVEDDVQKPES
ncbi:Ankyrin repeat and MYND domain-containing protein 2 [Holothuria leucospilota]|uniref:Ankyrin repeat and MYND domain-containing protein 2 n=1 Tax=Holothuria leucospilota TaxID=206669 RepID=A0A9Q1BZC6_HOLLE|nr:Ankyrin repeat and MYND domain-containing protein 2 [Holothuria leucospilota]